MDLVHSFMSTFLPARTKRRKPRIESGQPSSQPGAENELRKNLLGVHSVAQDDEVLDGFGRAETARRGCVVQHVIASGYHVLLHRVVRHGNRDRKSTRLNSSHV